MNLQTLLGAGKTYVHTGDIDEQTASDIIVWLSNNRHHPKVTIVFMTYGGSVSYSLGIHDAIRLMAASMEIHLVALGMCQSSGAIVMSAVDIDRRHAGPNTRFMVHSVSATKGGVKVTCEPTLPSVDELRALKDYVGFDLEEAYTLQEAVVELLSRETNLGEDQIRKMFESDTFFSAEKAVEYGIVGHILQPEPDPVVPKRRWYQLGRSPKK